MMRKYVNELRILYIRSVVHLDCVGAHYIDFIYIYIYSLLDLREEC